MDDDPNRRAFEEAVRNANLPEFDFDKAHDDLKQRAMENTQHTPRQQGPYIVCVSCSFQHTLAFIGVTKSFKGVNEEGGYIVENRF